MLTPSPLLSSNPLPAASNKDIIKQSDYSGNVYVYIQIAQIQQQKDRIKPVAISLHTAQSKEVKEEERRRMRALTNDFQTKH